MAISRDEIAVGAPSRRATTTAGFTLLELFIVAALLVVLAGLAVPEMTRFARTQALRSDAVMVMSSLGGVRSRAIESGLAYQFRYEPGGRRFLVVPFDRPPELPTAGSAAEGESPAKTLFATSGTLSEQLRFEASPSTTNHSASTQATLPMAERLPELWLNLIPDGANLADVSWSPPLLFYPDGRSDGGTVDVVDRAGRRLPLTVRALTGTVTLGTATQGGP